MLSHFFLQLLFPPTAHFFHVVHHVAHGLQYQARHCRMQVVAPRHWHPKPYGHWEKLGVIRWSCQIWDRAGTMHPAGLVNHLRRAGV